MYNACLRRGLEKDSVTVTSCKPPVEPSEVPLREGPGAAGLPGLPRLGREMGIRTSQDSPDTKPPYPLSRETRARELTLLRADQSANHLSRKQSNVSPCPDAFSPGALRRAPVPGRGAAGHLVELRPPTAQRAAGGDLALPGLGEL